MAKNPDDDLSPVEYLEKKQKEIIDRVFQLAETGKSSDAVRLKANLSILNKLVPDRTKMELDIKNKAPYEVLKDALEKGKKNAT